MIRMKRFMFGLSGLVLCTRAFTAPAETSETDFQNGSTAIERILGADAVPFPFDTLLAKLKKSTSNAIRGTYIPLGRTEEKTSAGENLFKSPNIIVGAEGDSIADQIYLHYSAATHKINVMSYDEGQAKYIFYVVDDYGVTPNTSLKLVAENQCVSCHQGSKPIYTDSMGDETTWSDVIRKLVKDANGGARSVYGLDLEKSSHDAYDLYFDTQYRDTEPFHKIWTDVCAGKSKEEGIQCRGNFLKTSFAMGLWHYFKTSWTMFSGPKATWDNLAASGTTSVDSIRNILSEYGNGLVLSQPEYSEIMNGTTPQLLKTLALRAIEYSNSMPEYADPRKPQTVVKQGFHYGRAVSDWAEQFSKGIFSENFYEKVWEKFRPQVKKTSGGRGVISFNEEKNVYFGGLEWTVSNGTDYTGGTANCSFDANSLPTICDVIDLHDVYGNTEDGRISLKFNQYESNDTLLSGIFQTAAAQNPVTQLVCYLDTSFGSPSEANIKKYTYSCGSYDFRQVSRRIDDEIRRNISGESTTLLGGPIPASQFAKLILN